ncbi:MAG: hypothetical protein ACTSWY_04640 [Promethearchaeota archaeon]
MDQEAYNAIRKYEISLDDEADSLLIVIIDNVHLANATKANWIRSLIFKPYERVKFILTSRTESLNVYDEDILEIFSKNDEYEKLRLEDEIIPVKQAKTITKMILSNIFQNYPIMKINEILKIIMERNSNQLELIQLELETLLKHCLKENLEEIDNKPTFDSNKMEKLLNNTSELEILIENEIVEKYEILISEINEKFSIESTLAWKILYLVFNFAYLEFPLRIKLLSDTSSIEIEPIQKFISHLEKTGLILKNQGNYLALHPLYCLKILEAIENAENNSDLADLIDYYDKILENLNGDIITDKIMNKTILLEPSLKADWNEIGLTSLIQNENQEITSERIIELANELNADDFVQIYRQINKFRPWNVSKIWNIWDSIGMDVIIEMLEQAGSIQGVMSLLNEIFYSNWPFFDDLLSHLDIDFFLNIQENDSDNYFERIFHYMNEWNYPGIVRLEVEYTLRNYFGDKPLRNIPSYLMNQRTFDIIDSLNASTILNELINNPETSSHRFFWFLQQQSQRFKTESKIMNEIIKFTLTDQIKTIPISIFGNVLHFMNNKKDSFKSEYSEIVNKWDIEVFHDTILELEPGWFQYLMERFSQWNIDIIRDLINKFTIQDILKILSKKEKIKDEGYVVTELERFTGILKLLYSSSWIYFQGLLDYYGVETFLKCLDEAEPDDYHGTNLIELLLSIEWNYKKDFIDKFDFYSWFTADRFYRVEKNLDLFLKSGIADIPKIIQYYFKLELKKDGIYIELRRILEICKEQNYDWTKWVDLDIIQTKLNTKPRIGFQFITLFEENGWKIPLHISSLREKIIKKNQSDTWNNLRYISLILSPFYDTF